MVEEAESADTKSVVLVRNERLKLSATYLNGVAIATLAVGGISPLVTGVLSSASGALSLSASVVVGCTVISAALHIVAWRFLGGLRA